MTKRVLIRLTPNGRHEPGSPLQDAEHSARSTEMDLIHRRSTSRITFRREQTTETWSLDTPNQSEAIVGMEKSKIPGGCQALGINRISMFALRKLMVLFYLFFFIYSF
jgi:hypothetical protein